MGETSGREKGKAKEEERKEKGESIACGWHTCFYFAYERLENRQ